MGYLKKPLFFCKVLSLVVGVASLGLGVFSHYESSWLEEHQVLNNWTIPLYEICNTREQFPPDKLDPKFFEQTCPTVGLELYFVAAVIICFALSIVILILGFVLELESHPLKWIDMGYHGAAAVLLLIASILYLGSAQEIDQLLADKYKVALGLKDVNLRKTEKIAAACLAIIQTAHYIVAALLIVKEDLLKLRHR